MRVHFDLTEDFNIKFYRWAWFWQVRAMELDGWVMERSWFRVIRKMRWSSCQALNKTQALNLL